MPLTPRLGYPLALLIVALLFGGGGSPAPIAELVVELVALALLALWAIRSPTSDNPIDRPLLICGAIFAAVPLVQLIPLPPALWHALPGREHEVAALALVDQAQSWRPISMAPLRTLASALSLIPALAMIAFVSRLDLRERSGLLLGVVALGLLSALVGLLQLVSGGSPRFYAQVNEGFATGFQANRNAYADLLLVALLAGAAALAGGASRLRTRTPFLLAAVAALFLLVSVVGSGSRTGFALIAVALVASVTILRRVLPLRGIALYAALGATLAVAAAGTAVMLHTGVGQKLAARFDRDEDQRPKIWEDASFALRGVWPVGSGVGTFVPVFEAAEQLQYVDASNPNRAHNDYLEFGIETGIAGTLLLLSLTVAFAWRVWAIVREKARSERRAQALFALSTLLVLGLHSLVDYPMRSMSLAVLLGVGVGLISKISLQPGGGHVRA